MAASQFLKSVFCVLCFTFLTPVTAFAQNAAGSAYGESVDLSIDSIFSLVTVEAQSGPIPMVSDSTSPAYNTTDLLIGVDVNANVQLVTDILPASTVDILETGILNVSTTGNTSPDSNSSASVEEVNLELLGDVLLPLVLGITADEVVSTASASGSCEAGLSASGTTSLVNANLASSLAQLADIEGTLLASPPANFVLLDLDLLGGHIRIVLNEQIVTGNGVNSSGITVNAIHVTIDNLPIAAIITDLTGEVIISQSRASVTCAEADLSVTLSDSPDPVTAGNLLTYTVIVTNSGPDSADNILLEHILPAGTTFGSAIPEQGSCNESSGTVSCNLSTLAIGESTSITVTVTPNAPGVINSSVSVSSDAHDPNLSNNTDTEDTTVDPIPGSADLSVVISDSPDPVTAGQMLTITLDVTNNGPNDAIDTVVVYTPPAGVPVSSVTPSQGTCSVGPTTVTCNLGIVLNGATPDIVIEMTPTVPSVLDHVATVSSSINDPLPANNIDTEPSVVIAIPQANADLSLVKSDDSDPIVAGQPLTYTLTISNNGPDGTNSVVVTDDLPASVLFQSAVASQGSCNHLAPTVTCNLGAIANGAGAIVTIIVIPQSAGLLSNTATVTSDVTDPQPQDNTDNEDTTVNPAQADLTITKVSSVDPATLGVPFQYTITVSNAGPDDATDVEVTDALPASLQFGSALPSQGNCEESGGTVTCALGTVATGANATVTIEVTPTEIGQLINTAVVDSPVDDPNPDDNTVDEDTVVESDEADLTITKVSSVDPATLGVPFQYTITVSNAGPDDATDVEVTDALPVSLQFGSAVPSQGNCAESDSTVTCALGTVANGANATVVIEVTPTEIGQLTNTAVVDSPTDDPNPDDNTVDEDTVVEPGEADLTVTKVSSVDPATFGVPFQYTITVSNAGPDDATDVEMTDALPASLQFGSAVPSQGNCQESGGTVTCSLGTVANGAVATVIIEVTPTETGQLTNTAVVNSPTDDPNPDNNSVDEGTVVEPDEADLSITKVSSVDPATVGVPFQYSITVSNAGPNDATDVEVTDDLPASLQFGSAVPSQGNCAENNGMVTCALGTVANGADATVIIEVTPTETGQLTNTAVVNSPVDDPNPDDNTVDEVTLVVSDDGGENENIAAIPSMDQRGLAILILTLLGIGMVTVRRFDV